MDAPMKVLSLFSGIGGFDIALERAGMEIVGQVEIDPYCNRVLAHHWPDVRRYGDVRDIGIYNRRDSGDMGTLPFKGSSYSWQPSSNGNLSPANGRVDLICGGFPCQDVSVAGKRAGLDGERSGLWFEFQRILSELRPTYALIENVPGLLSSNQGRDFAVILDGLGQCGFRGIGWRIFDSQHFGVPQRRRRVFIVCGPSAEGVQQILSLCESCGGNPAAGREAGEDVAHALTARPNASHRDDSDTYVPDLSYALAARNSKGVSLLESQDTLIAHTLRAEGFDASEDGTGRGTPLYAVRTAQTSSNGIGDADSVAYTLDGTDGQAVASAGVRRLTPVECERLQGFPDGWTDVGGAADGPRYRALGNAVTVSVVEYLGRRIMAVNA